MTKTNSRRSEPPVALHARGGTVMKSLPAPGARRVLLVEDEEAYAHLIQRSFKRRGASFELTIASTLSDGARALESHAFDLVISDWRLPDGEGFDLLKYKPRCPLLIMTSQGNEQIAVAAMRAGALDYIVKSENSLLDMPRIADAAIRQWTNLVAKEFAQEQFRIAEEALRERSLRLFADSMPQIVWTARPDGYVDYFNRRWYEFTGSAAEPAGNSGWERTLHPDDVQRSRDCWCSAMDSGSVYEIQSRLWDRKSEDYRWYLARALPQRDDRGVIVKWVGTATDIDDNKRLSEELERRVDERTKDLKQSLSEKTTLLQEVHHRVKNNLQVVCSLLSMQIAYGDDLCAGPLNAAHSRVLAMSLIHEQIYRSETLADLDFGEYIEALSDRVFKAYCVDPSRIGLERSLEAIHLTIDQAIPCGLILNELLSNSLKHAFTDGRRGALRVSLKKTESDRVELIVADNGIGLPADFRLENSRSLGLQVVLTLLHQLRADLSVTGEGGAVFRFSWQMPAK